MRETYRNERKYPFCPGCGHGLILDALNRALARLQLDPTQVVLVSDIGCQGLGDQYFAVNAFHGLHGRSIAYATGIKLANPDLKVIVLMGDGGAGIGGAHLLSAARRNIGLTVLVFNNFNFGMTGGEHSATTPEGGVTATTRGGNLERPLDLCATVAVNGAGLAWRGTAFDRDLPDVIADAICSESFALLDIWELCTAYYVANNAWSRKSLIESRAALGLAEGYVHRESRPEFAHTLHAAAAETTRAPGLRPAPLAPQYTSALDRKYTIVLAGSAGGKVRSAARLAAEAGVLSGLWAAQQDDYPVTVQTGHSISEVILSPDEVLFTGVERPDALIVATGEGRRAAARYLSALTDASVFFVTPEHRDLETPARKVVLDVGASGRGGKKQHALVMLLAAIRLLNIMPVEALEAAIRRGRRADVIEENLAALAHSKDLIKSCLQNG